MADRTQDGLKACITSLDTLIAPAVRASGDGLAAEQVALVSRYLGFMAARLDHATGRAQAELRLYAEMAEALASAVDTDPDAKALETRIACARALLDRQSTDIPAIEDASFALQSEISRITRGLRTVDPAVRGRLEPIIVAGSMRITDLQRAWFAPQGWEDAKAVPDLDSILRGD